MIKINKLIMIFAAVLIMTGCDKTEDGFVPGPASDIRLGVTQNGDVVFPADGGSVEIEVQSTVGWTVEKTESSNVFSVTPSSGKGNGKITVTASPNYTSSVREGSLNIIGVNTNSNFNITMNLRQSQFIFDMPQQNIPEIRATGGEFEVTFTSSIDWKFVVISGDSGNIHFSPGESGAGSLDANHVTVTIDSNTTTNNKNYTIALRPLDDNIYNEMVKNGANLPQNITISQQGNVVPQNVTASAVEAGVNMWDVTVDYTSGAKVIDCGVRVMRDQRELRKVSAEPTDGAYPMNGPVTVKFSWLNDEYDCYVQPFVTSEIGTTYGNSIDAIRLTKPEWVSGNATHLNGYDWKIDVDYSSGSSVTDAGIIVLKDYKEIRRVSANKVDGEYPKTGPVTVDFTWQTGEEGCRIVPFATTLAGTSEGSEVNIQYGIVINSVSFTEKDQNTWRLKVEGYSDVSIDSVRATIYDASGSVINTFDTYNLFPIEQEVYDLKLLPKTTYKIQLEIVSEFMNLKSGMMEFTTGSVKPGADDNTPPEV